MAAYHVFPSYDVLVVREISLFHKTPSPPNKCAIQIFATHSLALQQILQKMTGEFQGDKEDSPSHSKDPSDPLGLHWVSCLGKDHWHKPLKQQMAVETEIHAGTTFGYL